jgi:hypothetical protein
MRTVLMMCLALAGPASAALPECGILLRTGASGLHRDSISVAPGTAVAAEAHCVYGLSDPAPTFAWSNGSTRFDASTVAGAAGESTTLSVDVTQGGATTRYAGRIDAAPAGAPSCTISATPTTAPALTMLTAHASCPGATGYEWSSRLDFRGQGSDTVQVFDLYNHADPGILARIDVSGVNAAGRGPAASLLLDFTRNSPNCRLDVTPAGTVAPGTLAQVRATCDGDPVNYVGVQYPSGTAVLAPNATTEVLVVAYGPQLIGQSTTSAVIVGAAPPLRDYTGVWWAGSAQNGWGVTLNQHEDRLFAVIYLDDPRREPGFVVMSGGAWDATHTAFTGALYVPDSSWLGAYDASRFDPNTSVGSITLRFSNASTMYLSATLAYGADEAPFAPFATHLSRKLTPLLVNRGTNPAGDNYGDLWWGGGAENGWGLSITQQDATTFVAWYTYGRDGRATWYVLQSDAWNGRALTGPIYRVNADALLSRTFNGAATQASAVGTGTLTFSDAAHGSFSYSVDGVTQSKTIERLAF